MTRKQEGSDALLAFVLVCFGLLLLVVGFNYQHIFAGNHTPYEDLIMETHSIETSFYPEIQ